MRMQIVLTLAIGLAHAQPTPSPRFDVASVKLSGPQSVRGSDGGPGSKDPDRYIFNSATLLDLLAIGYQVEYYQISSKTALDHDRYDVLTKLPSGTTKAEFRAMLQNLLAERFHLKLHTISREFPGYELVIAKTGSRLKRQAGGPSPAMKAGFPELPADRPAIAATNTLSGGYPMVRLAARQSTIPELIRMLKPGDNLPIVDKTGLSGRYDFTLEFVRDRGAASPGADAEPPPAASLFTALQQQLGLQLIQKKVPLDVLVIDSFTRQPTEN